ncbi:MAG: hypothetical protein IPN89_15505 [Saprospiraceae bacterium]|nr:hypothetical protein [Saprospiraceae bacterium]
MAPDGRTLFACTNNGLYKSSNHGVTWVKNTSLPASAKANDIEFHPTNPQVICHELDQALTNTYWWIQFPIFTYPLAVLLLR